MKLITLNVWDGRMAKELEEFFARHTDVDIFCFQEVYHQGAGKDKWAGTQHVNFEHLDTLKKQLSNYQCFYHPHLGDWWGLAMFIKKGINVIDSGEIYVHKEQGYNYDLELLGHTAKNVQYASIETEMGPRTILNFHGLYTGKGKEDTHERVMQSQNIVAFLKTLENPYVLAGDFNLNPTTESMNLLEAHGMRNLIKEFGYTSTRTPLYEKDGKFADYVFVSGGIDALDFSVLPDVVSDHSPLYLEFE
ncbi:MAG: endonuclease/exonuclease/phosphatase family protein [Patescibacteria group bacterium]